MASFHSHATGQMRALRQPAQNNLAPRWHRSARFLLNVLVHVGNLTLRVWALSIFMKQEKRGTVAIQLCCEVVGAILSVQTAYHDADVRRWLSKSPCLIKPVTALFIFFVFGIGQAIHVKRAWARQWKVAGVLQSLEEEDKDFLWSGPALGAEHALPVALITGVPFALVSYFGFLKTEHEDVDTYILGAAVLSALCVVSLGVLEVDFAVSAYVAKRYHFDPSRKGTRAGRTQFLYPMFHGLYRFTEVLMRVTLLVEFLVFLLAKLEPLLGKVVGIVVSWGAILCDFLIGVMLMKWHSPQVEKFSVHILCGVGLLVTNVVVFVDMPGFCRPARLISRALEWWRFLQLVSFGVLTVLYLPMGRRFGRPDSFGDSTFSQVRSKMLLVTAVCHYLIRLTPVRTKMGDDLHTAVLRGHLERVRKLLTAGAGGETLDVNGRMKDARQATPAMLAAGVGNVEALRLLMSAGARMHLVDALGETCLHYAVRTAHIEALEFLLEQRGARTVLRLKGDSLREMAEQMSERQTSCLGLCSRRLDIEHRHRLLSALDFTSFRQARSVSTIHHHTGVRSNVPANNIAGRHLGHLFPHAIKEEVPPLTQLHSVSGLVLAHATGALARCVMQSNKQDDGGLRGGLARGPGFLRPDGEMGIGSGEVTLESLRRVRKLGQGAAGTIIEVEVMDDLISGQTSSGRLFSPAQSNSANKLMSFGRFGSILMADRRRSSAGGESPSSHRSHPLTESPRRYALKLQPKTQANNEWQACSELLALQRAVHPFIVRLEQAFQTPQYFALLMEFCPGGDVNKLLCSTQDANGRCSGLEVRLAALYTAQVLLALVHLHEALGIVYRDVKPENILLTSADQAKLADFGLAVYVGRGRKRMSVAGTAGFLAPELVFGASDGDSDCSEHDERIDPFKTDAYSFGVALEVMLLGEDCATVHQEEGGGMWMLPSSASEADNMALLEAARNRKRLQPAAHSLLIGLVSHRPQSRYYLRDEAVRRHPFFLHNLDCEDLSSRLLPRAPVHYTALGS